MMLTLLDHMLYIDDLEISSFTQRAWETFSCYTPHDIHHAENDFGALKAPLIGCNLSVSPAFLGAASTLFDNMVGKEGGGITGWLHPPVNWLLPLLLENNFVASHQITFCWKFSINSYS